MRWLLWLFPMTRALAQTPPQVPDQLTLEQAEAIAVKNHPQVSEALRDALGLAADLLRKPDNSRFGRALLNQLRQTSTVIGNGRCDYQTGITK